MASTATASATQIAELNDLLQLDHDAVGAYDIAIEALQSKTHEATLRRFKGDHERHIRELTHLIRERGGTAIQLPHLPSGIFKLAVQKAGSLGGGDAAVLLAFKANERQVRDKYRRAVERADDPEVRSILDRNADDEAAHYAWSVEALELLGVGEDTAVGRAERVVEVAHGKTADVMEGAGKRGMAALEAARRRPMRALALGGLALAAVTFMRRR